MPIREANPGDLDAIMEIVQAGKAIMVASGNPSQWLSLIHISEPTRH